MKTRREFFKVFAGSCAVLVACVVAPKSLMEKEPENPFNLENVKKGLEKMDHATSGYVHIGPFVEPSGSATVTITGFTESTGYPWKYLDSNGKWVKA